MNIKFAAITCVFDWSNEDSPPIEDPEILKTFDGLKYDEETVVDYMGDGSDTRGLYQSAKFTGGYLQFQYDEATNRLAVITEYDVDRDLDDQEILQLREYTGGQWSDGVGSNFAQSYPEKTGLSPQIMGWDDDILTLVDDVVYELPATS
ncbi:MAG: hypothetical protein QNJ00_04805 [Woeseiaceae bacterium]|nr:hypothetical protein [Woeseiaceae bacterium]